MVYVCLLLQTKKFADVIIPRGAENIGKLPLTFSFATTQPSSLDMTPCILVVLVDCTFLGKLKVQSNDSSSDKNNVILN